MISIVVLLTYIFMVTMNALANILPINGVGTGEVSAWYPNLFTPAAKTFAVWGVIYLLLLLYTLYQLKNIKQDSRVDNPLFEQLGRPFAVSSLLNGIWIYAWHHNQIGWTVLIMICLLGLLIYINYTLKKVSLQGKDICLIKVPFEVYFGWITVATIANITVLLVKLNWNRFGQTEVFWAVLMITLGAMIGAFNIQFYQAPFYGCVMLWAYGGILAEHMGVSGYRGEYPMVVGATIGGMVILLVGELLLVRKKCL
ncbi:MAG: tryptophan-rich sensory protein [Clostridia bacterium]|nr:tryptophan-rich sensory protein [Clostridia bacterium]